MINLIHISVCSEVGLIISLLFVCIRNNIHQTAKNIKPMRGTQNPTYEPIGGPSTSWLCVLHSNHSVAGYSRWRKTDVPSIRFWHEIAHCTEVADRKFLIYCQTRSSQMDSHTLFTRRMELSKMLLFFYMYFTVLIYYVWLSAIRETKTIICIRFSWLINANRIQALGYLQHIQFLITVLKLIAVRFRV